jgi:hypothetical protein
MTTMKTLALILAAAVALPTLARADVYPSAVGVRVRGADPRSRLRD